MYSAQIQELTFDMGLNSEPRSMAEQDLFQDVFCNCGKGPKVESGISRLATQAGFSIQIT